MVGLFFKCVLAMFLVAVVVGLFLSDKSIENATKYSIFTGVGGIGIGILVLIFGFFTARTGRETVYSYENTHGDTVRYIGNEYDWSTMDIGFFISLLSLAAVFLFPIGMLIGISISEKIRSTKDKASSNISETRKKGIDAFQKIRTKAAEDNGKIKKNITIVIVAVLVIVTTLVGVIRFIIPNNKYTAAMELYDFGKYDEAIEIFTELNGYKDSAEMISNCETEIKEKQYSEAVDLYNEGEYSNAIKMFSQLDGYKDSRAQIGKCEKAINDAKYNTAVELIDKGDYEKAYNALIALDGYRDSAVLANDIYSKYEIALIKKASVGSEVIFGSYWQGDDGEEVEWIVLEKQEDKVLLLSKYGLAGEEFNDSIDDNSWRNSSIRKWLNESFLNAAFNDDEKKSILVSNIVDDKDSSNVTEDSVFLLSSNEVEKYLVTNDARQCKGTRVCYDDGAFEASNRNCNWWLRSPGSDYNYGTLVVEDGSLYTGMPVTRIDAVRPALWLNIVD